ncbi:hypothetical protein M8J76_016439 [Diaphorina citri]|nr:hypothetical protein M8J76_016439 [Diaphorina citri]
MKLELFLRKKKEKKPAPPPAASRGNAKPIMTGPGSGLTTEVMRKILCDEAAGHVNKHDYHKAIKDYDVGWPLTFGSRKTNSAYALHSALFLVQAHQILLALITLALHPVCPHNSGVTPCLPA